MDPQDDDPLVGLAAALAGEPVLAAELLAEVDVLAPAAPGDDDLGESRRTLLVQRFLRRRSPRPAAEHPELAEELRPVRQRVDALEPFPRAVLVLRHHQRLLVAELARITERSPAAVNRTLDAAEAAVASDPFTLDLVLARAPRPEPGAVRASARRFAALRRRRRGRVVLAVLTVVVLLAGAGVLPGLLRPDPYVRGHGEWVHGFTLAPSTAFTVEGRSLSAGEDSLTLVSTGESPTTCDVVLTTERERMSVPVGRAVEVDHRPGRFLAPTDADFGTLWLAVGPRTAARVTCEVRVEDAVLLQIAGLLRYGPDPMEVPFALRGLPAPDEVRTVFDYQGSVGVILTPAGQLDGSTDTLYISVPDVFGISRARPTSVVAIRGARGEVVQGVDGQSVCWPADGKRICAGTFPQDATGNQKDRLLERLVRTARLLELAPDLDDRGTWFDAREALPR